MSHLNRREFLHAGSAAACTLWMAAHVRADSHEEIKRPSQAIDTHTHFYDPTRSEGVPWPSPNDAVLYRKVTPEEFQKVSAPYGVTGTVAVEASPWLEDNQWLLDLADAHPIIQGIIGRLDLLDGGFQTHLGRFTKHPLYKGVRINSPFGASGENPAFIPGIQALADAGLIVDVNGPVHGMIDLLSLKKKVPHLRLVIEHLPKAPLKDSAQQKTSEAAMRELASFPDVYAKVSHVIKKPVPESGLNKEEYWSQLDQVWEIFGSEKVMYGSDWPVSARSAPYGTVFGLVNEYVSRRGQEETEKYFWKNAQAAYRLL
ncbi:MAG TPA: amidohydrolase family protein [Planctomicrobium sp.]|nr:amidohydrolase family protein [Planctomicrobium sp.]